MTCTYMNYMNISYVIIYVYRYSCLPFRSQTVAEYIPYYDVIHCCYQLHSGTIHNQPLIWFDLVNTQWSDKL